MQPVRVFVDLVSAYPFLALRRLEAFGRDGRDLTDARVRAELVAACGLDAAELEARAGAAEVKAELRRLTDEALALGVFGVPTFELDGELFWGHDRLGALARRLGGAAPPSAARVAQALARPRAVERRRRG